MSEDVVNNPSHYNKQGIEVIDVIETYAKTDFRLANVIKYVCRCEYKGSKLQDLQKAYWYLNRVIGELVEEEVGCDKDPFGDHEAPTQEEMLEALEQRAQAIYDEDHLGPGYTEREVGVFFQGYDCRKQEEAEIADPCAFTTEELDAIVDKKNELYQTFVHPTPDRIAGDDAAATRIKDNYYEYKRFEIQGYCANCDSEIQGGQPYVTVQDGYDTSLKFCSQSCVEKLRTWQKELS